MKPLRHLLALLAFALPAAAGPILSPSTTTYGGIVSGGNFVAGGSGTNFDENNWPTEQGPTEAVDGVIGPGSKYLNFNVTNTALIFSGTTARVAQQLELWVAEDEVNRDPASYKLYGTNADIPATLGTPTETFALTNFTQISSGDLALPATRDLTADATGFSQSIPIPNTIAYASYLLVFPTVKNAPTTANSMQISEVQLFDATIVTTLDDEDDGSTSLATPADISLREAVKYSLSGSPITFAPALSGQTITLTHAGGDMEIPGALTIDATALPGGLTVSGNNTSRHFFVGNGKSLTLRGLTLAGGNGARAVGQGGDGGAISNVGTLTLTQCTLSGNSATNFGGAIFNFGTLTLTQCTLSGNSANFNGGAIFNSSGTLTLTQCTLSGNSATNGGAIYNDDTLRPTQCTLSGNSATNGGAIYNKDRLILTNSIIAGNSAPTGPDIFTDGASHFPPNPNGVNLLSNLDGAGLSAGPSVIVGEPRLAPLGDYGGPTQTMPPRPGSPAIDTAGTTDPGGTDARGFPRFVDGNASGAVQLDIGAVEAAFRFVTIPEDSGAGSLRQAIAAAAAQPGWEAIAFTAAVTPHITLASEILIDDIGGVTIDASDRPAGLVIDAGPGTNRHFRIESGATATFHRLRLSGGGGTGGGAPADYGGSIYNSGTLTLRECMFMDNSSANAAGAIFNQAGLLTIERSTFANNTAGGMGAILQESLLPMTITASTFTNNVGRFEGGALSIANFRPATLIHCTITGNAVTNTGGGGVGGIRTVSGAGNLLTLQDCIVTGNTDANFPGVPNVATGFSSQGNNLTSGDAKLAPLGDYGGPTQTMALRPGSPALNAAPTSTATSDQRGFPAVGVKDIGAYEAGTLTNYDAWIWETLPSTATLPQTAATFDFDGDGKTNADEFTARTDPGNAASYFRVTQFTLSGGQIEITIPTVAGRSYRLQGSPDLVTWTNSLSHLASDTSHTFSFTLSNPPPAYFYRVEVADP